MSRRAERKVEPNTLSYTHDVTVLCGRDKSLTHRSVMFASLAVGESRVEWPLLGADCLSTINCFRALGVEISVDADSNGTIKIKSPGARGLRSPVQVLDCGNSGTTARLLTGILSALPGMNATLVGDSSLSRRPMDRIAEPLRELGADVVGQTTHCYMPLTVTGCQLLPRAVSATKASAQIKSAVILAGMLSRGPFSITLPKGGRDHTERMLRQLGADLSSKVTDTFEEITIVGPFSPPPQTYFIPVDPSSAAFLAVLGLLRRGGKVTLPDVLDNPTRSGFIRILQEMAGVDAVSFKGLAAGKFIEAVGTLTVHGGQQLMGASITSDFVPTLVDEIPILAVAAAFACSPSRFSGLGELRVKESDRLAKTCELLHLAGAKARIEGDDLCIDGGLSSVKPFVYDTREDHRLAMAATILAQKATGPCVISDPECVSVSFPHFFDVIDENFARRG